MLRRRERSAASNSPAKSLTLASGGKDAADGAPVCVALAALKAPDEGGIYPQPLGDLFLGHPGLLAQ